MTRRGYICIILLAAILSLVPACTKLSIRFEDSQKEIAISPVTSLVSKTYPGPHTTVVYPTTETMGIMAFYSSSPAGQWENANGVAIYNDGEKLMDRVEFGYRDRYAAWGGVSSTLADGKRVPGEDVVYQWPETGSLIFAGFSPYYKMEKTHADQLVSIKDKVSFDVQNRTLEITDYTVGQYIPMSAAEIADPDIEYKNVSQSDLMYFLPEVVDGKYVGVNRESTHPVRFHHALSLVEFKVKAEDDYDVDRIHIDRITLGEVYHTGNFSVKIEDDGSIVPEWTDLESHGAEDVHVFGDGGGHDGTNELLLDMDLRSVAQLLIIPGPTHPITVGCNVYTMGRYYDQTYVVKPEEVGITKWEPGKRYVYNLILGLNKLTFSPETYDWNDIDGGGYSEPINEDN